MAGNSTTTTTTNPMVRTNDLEFHDFIDGENFNDQFVNLIRGDQSDHHHHHQHQHDLIVDYHFDFGLMNTCLVDNNQFGPTNPSDFFGFGNAIATGSDPNSKSNLPMQSFNGEIKGDNDSDHEDEEEEEDNDKLESSATNNTSSTCKSGKNSRGKKADRSRTLVSERRRRGRMKEKLYALRALVPNITKMDKASIIRDAVLYVQDVQKQAKKLKDEISSLEASLMGPDRYQGSILNPRRIQVLNNQLLSKRIIQMDMFQVEERGFYLKLVCNKNEGVAASLYKMLESLTNFNVQNSNLASAAETFMLTVTLNVRDCVREIINLPNLKLWVVGALIDQGFEFKSPFST